MHAAFYEGCYYIWGEVSFRTSAAAERLESGDGMLPWASSAKRVKYTLESVGIIETDGPDADTRTRSGYIAVPARGGVPLVSTAMLGEPPASTGELRLRNFRIRAVEITYGELCALSGLLDSENERLAIPGVLFADDLRALCRALKYTALITTRGVFIPGIKECGDTLCSVWKPLYLPKYQEERLEFFSSLPDSLFAFSRRKSEGPSLPDVESCADSLIENLLDALIRESLAVSDTRGRLVDSDNTHEVWMRSLGWPSGTLDRWDDKMDTLISHIDIWVGYIRSFTRQPWKFFLRIDELPCNENGERFWTLSWHLRSVRDPSLIIPAARVWSPGPAERSWFDTIDANPRKFMLQILGNISAFVPAIKRSLSERTPTECRLDLEELFNFLTYHAPAMMERGIDIRYPSGWGDFSNGPKLSVKGRARDPDGFTADGGMSASDLMEVDWSVSLGDDVLTEDELKLLTELKTPLLELRGRWVLLSKKEISAIIEGIKKLPDKITYREALLFTLKENIDGLPMAGIGGSQRFDAMQHMLRGRAALCEMPAAEGFNGKLRPYQGRGLSWLTRLANLGLGGCLADDMGLGKTVQSLALVHKLRNEGETRPALLVCPTSVMENWRLEAARFIPDEKIILHHGAKRLKGNKFVNAASDAALVISSYGLLQRNANLYSSVDWCGVILDEAQNIKNPATRQFKAARSIKADWRFALTGTPVENHVGDMWSIMEFALPGLMPRRTQFAREFIRPIQAGDKKAAERVKALTGPFILRRLKTDKEIVSDLPEKIETKVFCSLGREQASLYNSVLSVMDGKLAESEGIARKGLVLSAINSLKQICNHPVLYLKDKSELPGRSGKLERLTEIVEEMLSAGDRMLIFTQYAAMGAILRDYLQNVFGKETFFLHGGVSRPKRDEMVRRFQNDADAPKMFVLSLRAGGTGLNLTRANHVIMFDRWWNPAVERQAVDRVHRIGQDKSVQVHYFLCRGTLEEKIEALIKAKKEVAELAVGSGERWITELSDEEVIELLTLNSEAVE